MPSILCKYYGDSTILTSNLRCLSARPRSHCSLCKEGSSYHLLREILRWLFSAGNISKPRKSGDLLRLATKHQVFPVDISDCRAHVKDRLFFLANFMEYADLAGIGGDLLDILFFCRTARPENSPDPEFELAAREHSGLTPGRRH